MRRTTFFVLAVTLILVAGCRSNFVNAKVSRNIKYYSDTFSASPNECYYALRWALKINGYPIAKENLHDGIIMTTWEPVKSDSYYLLTFGRRDYGVTGAYHQLEVKVMPRGSKTKVEVGSRVKSVVSNLHSSGIEERKVLAQMGSYLRSTEPLITNEGIAE